MEPEPESKNWLNIPVPRAANEQYVDGKDGGGAPKRPLYHVLGKDDWSRAEMCALNNAQASGGFTGGP